MLRFLVTAIVSYLAWLAFTFSFSSQNLFSGLFVALCVSFIARRFLFHKRPSKALNPFRWGCFIAYFFLLIYCEIKSHLDVAYRVITGKIDPGIVRVKTKARTDLGKTLLGNSITLTPGTLIVSAEDGMYMHAIHYEKGHGTPRLFEKISRRATE